MTSRHRSSLARLRGRSLAELRFRGTQAATALLERLGFGDLAQPHADGLGTLLHEAAGPAGGAAWCQAFRAREGHGFFAGFDDVAATLRRARESDPAGLDAVLTVANDALAGRFSLLGYRDLSFGEPVDWHLDPVLGVRSPRAHWSRIAYLNPEVSGDHKVVWELNRHQWMVSLGVAWRATGDDRYAAAVAAYLDAWMDANPPKRGVNWSSSLEIAFRAISWLWTLRLLGTAAALPNNTVLRAVGHLRLAARHLTRNLSTYFSPNTHLTGEALALYYLGHELRDLEGAERWRATGREVMLRWLPTHVRADGTYFEQYTWYHRYTLDFYLHFWLLAQRTGDALPGDVRRAIGRLGQVLAHVMRPNGTMPLIGDDDGGRLLFLDGRTQGDPRPALTSAGLAGQDPALCALGTVTADTLGLFGADAVARVATLRQRAAHPTPSHLFELGGVVTMRTDWSRGASLLVMDAGPHGAMNCGHAHADALGIDLTVNGTPLFVDPGTLGYTTDPEVRNRFRATRSHNAATVDGADSSVMAGPFAWATMAITRVLAWSASPAGDYIGATHDGYGDGYVREVIRVPVPGGDVWVVRDRFRAVRDVLFEARLQCAPGIQAAVVDGRWVRLLSDGRPVADVVMADGVVTVTEGEVSLEYGRREPSSRLCASRRGSGQLSLCTVIGPALTSVASTGAEGAAGTTLNIETGAGRVVVVLSEGGVIAHEDVLVDARAWWGLRSGKGDALQWWRAVGARQVRVGGAVVMESQEPRDAGWTAGGAPFNLT